jgi:hypothetical protein
MKHNGRLPVGKGLLMGVSLHPRSRPSSQEDTRHTPIWASLNDDLDVCEHDHLFD